MGDYDAYLFRKLQVSTDLCSLFKRFCAPIDMSIWRTVSSMFKVQSEEEISILGAGDSLNLTAKSGFRRLPATDMERVEAGYF